MSRDKEAEQILVREQQIKKIQIDGVLAAADMDRFRVDGQLTKHHEKYTFKLITSYEQSIKFSELDKIAQAFQTKEIDFVARSGDGGGCDTCGYGADEGDLTITVQNAVIE